VKQAKETAPRICRTCVLPDTFPNIRFSPEGVCNFCQDFKKDKAQPLQTEEHYREKFLDLLERLERRPAPGGRRPRMP